MRDESAATNRTKSKGRASKASSGFGALQFGQESVANSGGRLSGEFADSISLIEPAS